MKLFISIFFGLSMSLTATAQDNIYPAKANTGIFFIINARIHVGNGTVIEKGTIKVEKSKITAVGENIPIPVDDIKVFDAKGQDVYPGLILPVTDLGLKEIALSVRGSNDFLELGDLNPGVRAIVAYNTDSKIINVLKANGILLACVTPQGGSISGSSSVVQLDAWNWEDAAYKIDNAIHVNLPSFVAKRSRSGSPPAVDPTKESLNKIEEIKSFFRQAKAYLETSAPKETNTKFEAVKGLFDKKQKLFVHGNQVKQILFGIDFAKEFGFEVVVVGGSESFMVADLLKENNIPVILHELHDLPAMEDDDVDQPYKTPAVLQKAGVLFALNDEHEESRYRNLMFNAGTAAAFGLTKEQALQAITLNSAKILGIDDRTGSIEVGKDANIIISKGDILDMKSSILTRAFIQGREVSLENKQTQLYERYMTKYGLK
ncbi:MAG: amidohydrolase [Bacteroidetes bacterium]|nr:MAG: amidohydrolase [Bacteroidota bacterium]